MSNKRASEASSPASKRQKKASLDAFLASAESRVSLAYFVPEAFTPILALLEECALVGGCYDLVLRGEKIHPEEEYDLDFIMPTQDSKGFRKELVKTLIFEYGTKALEVYQDAFKTTVRLKGCPVYLQLLHPLEGDTWEDMVSRFDAEHVAGYYYRGKLHVSKSVKHPESLKDPTALHLLHSPSFLRLQKFKRRGRVVTDDHLYACVESFGEGNSNFDYLKNLLHGKTLTHRELCKDIRGFRDIIKDSVFDEEALDCYQPDRVSANGSY